MNSPSEPLLPIPSSDPDEPLREGLRWGLVGLAVLFVVGAALWTALSGTRGLYGVLVGAGVGGVFVLTTVVLIKWSGTRPPSQAYAIVMFGWFVKMLIVLVVMVLVSRLDFCDRNALVFSLIGSIVLVLGGEVYGVVRTRTPYVDAEPDKSAGAD